MKTRELSETERQAIVNALYVAAGVYKQDAVDSLVQLGGDERLHDQFKAQEKQAKEMAELLEQTSAIIVNQ